MIDAPDASWVSQVEPILASGTLVPDGITIELIRERLGEEDTRRGFVLDGFPRNTAQAEALAAMLEEIGRRLDAVLFFELSDEIATERLLERSSKEGRADDQPEAIARRLATYHAETEPLVGYYRGARGRSSRSPRSGRFPRSTPTSSRCSPRSEARRRA